MLNSLQMRNETHNEESNMKIKATYRNGNTATLELNEALRNHLAEENGIEWVWSLEEYGSHADDYAEYRMI